jgi:uncharacterized protein with ATP-grasp and redox domains
MKTTIECIPCIARQAAEAAEMAEGDTVRRERLLRRLLREIAAADWNVMPVEIAQRVQRTVRSETGHADSYRALKDRMNRVALDLKPGLLAAARREPDPRAAIVRLAIAGNLLDAGSKVRLAPEDLEAKLQGIFAVPLAGTVTEFFAEADKARSILYLADNAGEIVFDRLLIEALPAGRTTVVVRGTPVINDATRDDAAAAGIHEVAELIDNGSDAPGTLLAECSEEFQARFAAADLVISKGQGNFETLSDVHKRMFFLLTVKCPMVAAAIGAPVGAMVVKRARNGSPPAN